MSFPLQILNLALPRKSIQAEKSNLKESLIMSDNEFTFAGQKVEKITLAIGLAMIIWGGVVTIVSDSQSLTSLIPSAIGLPMLILGYLAIKYEHRKSFFMHLAVIVGLVMFIGGLDLIRTLLGDSIVFNNFCADLSKLILLIFG